MSSDSHPVFCFFARFLQISHNIIITVAGKLYQSISIRYGKSNHLNRVISYFAQNPRWCQEKNIPFQSLLIVQQAIGHPEKNHDGFSIRLGVWKPINRAADSWTLISSAQVAEHTRVQTGPGITERLETASEDWGISNTTAMALLGNQIWLGRENGLKVYETDFPRIRLAVGVDIPDYLQCAEITALASDGQVERSEIPHSGDVWIGTRNGLFQYRSGTGNWTPHTVLNGLAGNDISTITAGGEFVWVGTAGEGLSRYNKRTQKWESFNLNDGLADNNIRGIALDGKYVWIGTFIAGGVG